MFQPACKGWSAHPPGFSRVFRNRAPACLAPGVRWLQRCEAFRDDDRSDGNKRLRPESGVTFHVRPPDRAAEPTLNRRGVAE